MGDGKNVTCLADDSHFNTVGLKWYVIANETTLHQDVQGLLGIIYYSISTEYIIL